MNAGKNQKSIFWQAAGKSRIRMAVWGLSALVWWGLLYPELYFTETTCQPVLLQDGQEIPVELEDCREVLCADGDKIIVSSRFLEWWNEKKESYQAEKDGERKEDRRR